MTLTEQFAEFTAGTTYAGIPEAARRKAKECILDCLGVAIAGTRESIVPPLLQYVDAVGGLPQATLIGSGKRTSITNAALVNGAIGHVLDFDDTNQLFIGHGSVVIVPAILALAEHLGSTGEDVIAAFMVGTEIQWKLGEALVDAGDHYLRGWHSTCTVGAFGATASAAWLLKLDREQMRNAFGIAASEAAGFQEQFGTHCKPFHAGRANEIGIRAALLAKGGLTSSKTALEGNVGFLKLVAGKMDLSKISNFGAPWGILEKTFGRGINLKANPVCASGVGGIEGMQRMLAEHKFKAADVESIAAGVRPKSLNILMYHTPETGLEAKFSAEYWMAATIVYGRVGLEQVTDAAVQNPEVQALLRKVKVYPDESILVSAARVNITVKLKDGREITESYYPPKGAADNPMTEQELGAKFAECMAWGGISEQKITRAKEIVLGLEKAKSVPELMQALVA
ncbi:MAG: MmgE/PrpD family protein [Burkholderiales bacterium]